MFTNFAHDEVKKRNVKLSLVVVLTNMLSYICCYWEPWASLFNVVKLETTGPTSHHTLSSYCINPVSPDSSIKCLLEQAIEGTLSSFIIQDCKFYFYYFTSRIVSEFPFWLCVRDFIANWASTRLPSPCFPWTGWHGSVSLVITFQTQETTLKTSISA